jgi:HPt (histidine-containing phosphotransfer) domain-containing protein
MDAIERALGESDLAMVAAKAHELKGASSNLQANAAMIAASLLESAARNADVTHIGKLTEALHTEVQRAVAYIKARDTHRSVA